MAYAMKGGSWAQPTQKMMSNNNKNLKTFGKVTPIKMKATAKKSSKKGFNQTSFDRTKKKVFGMY